MLIGVLLAVTWLILVIRYPHKALPVSLAALCGLLLLAAVVVWQQEQQSRRLSRVEIRLQHDLVQCPGARPLRVEVHNGNSRALRELRWKLYVHSPGQSANLIQGRPAELDYDGPGNLLADARWQECLPLPALRPGYRPQSLEYRAIDLRGRFTR
ncbi:multidrug transporter [Pseudomonas mangrovi]|jgi:hypothetical protein|uniref:Multidrug transporter n=1 Tax=Pseudomonas mangrovi TaxID=2161748 RepID=A0A2T5PC97_9PSED|nr:multidrug transporter [Pseudomonas mangrovi]PTU75355.1 multidrug transporter [Pseudomonas mangrovi]